MENTKKSSLQDIYAQLHADANGLSQTEATKRLKTYGYNTVTKAKKASKFLKFLSYFKSPLIIILLICAGVSLATGEHKNSIIIVAMVFLSVILNYYQENKSSKAVDEILKKLEIKSRVLRD